jgi:Type III restriction enzyme, res subunit
MDHVTGPGQDALRAWQREALEAYEQEARRDFLVTATPGSGKTTFALTLAARLFDRRVVDRVIVVCPTDHLRTQWAETAGRAGIALDSNLPNSVGPLRPDVSGYVATYAQVAARPRLHAARTAAKRAFGDPRRGAPRRRRAHLGPRGGRGVRGRDSAVVPDHLMALVAS